MSRRRRYSQDDLRADVDLLGDFVLDHPTSMAGVRYVRDERRGWMVEAFAKNVDEVRFQEIRPLLEHSEALTVTLVPASLAELESLADDFVLAAERGDFHPAAWVSCGPAPERGELDVQFDRVDEQLRTQLQDRFGTAVRLQDEPGSPPIW